MIFVTKPYLPNQKKYQQYVEKIYKTNHLTNFGPLSIELQEKLAEYLKVKHVLYVANGTLALQIAYKVVGLERDDEVVTTPFSFAATTETLVWERLNPVFCDIDEKTFCINPHSIKHNITNHTKAILAVHVFGNSCEVEHIDKIATTNNLQIIYDAAHSFGVNYKGKSILEYGDISTISFHATKIFHTIEGGGIISNDKGKIDMAKELINFGFNSNVIKRLGINAKNSEFHAAMGLCVLEDIELIMESREEAWEYYFTQLHNDFQTQTINAYQNNNFHYFPILFKDEETLLKKVACLQSHNIFPRRYFYPSLETLPIYTQDNILCPISRDISSRILCLPLFVGITREQQDKIIDILKED